MERREGTLQAFYTSSFLQVKFPRSGFLPEAKLSKLAQLLPASADSEPMSVDGAEEVRVCGCSLWEM